MVQKAKKCPRDHSFKMVQLRVFWAFKFQFLDTTFISVWCGEASPESKPQMKLLIYTKELKELQFEAVLLWSDENTPSVYLATRVHCPQGKAPDKHCKIWWWITDALGLLCVWWSSQKDWWHSRELIRNKAILVQNGIASSGPQLELLTRWRDNIHPKSPKYLGFNFL